MCGARQRHRSSYVYNGITAVDESGLEDSRGRRARLTR